MHAAENWCVKVEDKIYGPYSSVQMRKYAHEGRLAASSLIAPAGSRAWCEARKESAFASFFGAAFKYSKKSSAERIFGKRDTTDANAENDNRNKKAADDVDVANFVIIFDVVCATASRVEAAILSLGNAFRISDNVWSLSSELTAVGVRNALAPYLTPRESIFVVDATRGRSSWQNYAAPIQAKITAAYTAPRVVQTRQSA